jgi:hypothetical protein
MQHFKVHAYRCMKPKGNYQQPWQYAWIIEDTEEEGAKMGERHSVHSPGGQLAGKGVFFSVISAGHNEPPISH